jgi:hypothetical protein
MKRFGKLALVLGVFLWVGALSPEIFLKSGTGCILDEDGDGLDMDGARGFMEAFFYSGETVEIKYRFAIGEFLGGIK